VRYDPYGVFAQSGVSALAHRARSEGQTIAQDDGNGVAAVPVKVRGGHAIGTIEALKPEGEGAWTPEELGVLASLVEQLGIALDGAQLYQEAQRRAERERIAAGISARMRETLSIDAVLQAAIREIGDVLGLAAVEVRMRGEVDAVRCAEAER
jgi:GAF domain-containing protein